MKATIRAAALAGTVSLFALTAPVLAQDAAAPVDDVAITSPDEAPPGEIVVTAQKRTERLQDVPVAVSVLGAEALATPRCGQDRRLRHRQRLGLGDRCR